MNSNRNKVTQMILFVSQQNPNEQTFNYFKTNLENVDG